MIMVVTYLVSASAGSGKTTVLSATFNETKFFLVPVLIKLLVVTFTKAAAAEMKKRIKDSIIK
ncbi:UvrD-helicase domain-containing protein [Lactobacillus sp. R2/2]|nr:UvrD-helicase domain-containing protein [Lactobacillus sp. R2/2]